MSAWWFGIVVAIAAIVGIVSARRGGRGAAIAEDLFEGLLPSAMTGGPHENRPHEGWGLRWTDDVTNLTAKDYASPPEPQRGPRTAESSAVEPARTGTTRDADHAVAHGTASPSAIDS
jgi:hypothetical protein